MMLSDLASLSTAISGLVVTVSLVYLAIQTRQNTKHTRSLIQQGGSARTTAIMLAQTNPENSAAWLAGNGVDPTPAEIRRFQFSLMCGTLLTAIEDTFSQHCDGLLTSEQFGRNRSIYRGLLSEPGTRAFWNAMRPEMLRDAPRFTAFVDSLCVGDAAQFQGRV